MPDGRRYCAIEALARQHVRGVVHLGRMVTSPDVIAQNGPHGLFVISATSSDAYNYARVVMIVVPDMSDIIKDRE